MKLRGIFLTVIVGILLSGCGDNRQVRDNVERKDCVESSYLTSGTTIVEGQKGYYVLKSSSGDNYLSYVSKADLSNEIFLCGKPECKHISTEDNKTYSHIYHDCNAFIGENTIPNSIRYYGNNIYVLALEMGQATLCRISESGSEHEKMAELGPISKCMSGVYDYIVEGDYVYVLYSGEGYKKNQVYELYKLSLKSGKKEVLLQDDEKHLDGMKLYGSCLFFRGTDVETGTDSTIKKYNLNTGTVENIASDDISFFTISDTQNMLLYWRMGEGLVGQNLITGEQKVLRKSDEIITNAWLACNGKYVVLDNMAAVYMTPGSRHILEIIDIENAVSVAVVECSEKISMVLNCDEKMIIAKTGYDQYAYIDFQDIVNGKEPVWKDLAG